MNICSGCGACFEDGFDLCAYDGGGMVTPFAGPRVLGDRYLLEQRLAQGAMGVVFRATHLQLGSTVAVKLMQPRGDELRVALARFHREAQILGQIKHPNAVLVMDYGVEERGNQPVPYLVTEYLRGVSLESRLEERGPLSLAETERLITPLCDAVEEAHQVGVVHRDIKPSNVFLEKLRDGSDVVKVLDFGIAKFVELSHVGLQRKSLTPAAVPISDTDFVEELMQVRSSEAGTVTLRPRHGTKGPRTSSEDAITEAGFMVGTIPYMAPEQMTGGRISRNTDVYAIATLIFRLLAGRLPFEGDDDDIIDAKLTQPPPTLRSAGVDAPQALEDVMLAAFSLQPAQRPESVLALAEALRSAASTQNKLSPRPSLMNDVGLATLTLQEVGATAEAWDPTADKEEAYLAARDRILALDAVFSRLRHTLQADNTALAPDLNAALGEPIQRLEAAFSSVTHQLLTLTQRSRGGGDYVDYLLALWGRIHASGVQVVETLRQRVKAPRPSSAPFSTALFGDVAEDAQQEISDLADQLLARDILDSADALETLLRGHLDVVTAALARAATQPDPLADRLAQGLFRHADELLLLELFPTGTRVRLLPLLARLKDVPGAQGFLRLARLFGPEPAVEAAAVLEAPVASLDAEHPDRILRRCLLVHPDPSLRDEAIAGLQLTDFWGVVLHPCTPLHVERAIFQAVQAGAPNEYLKVFFLCVRDNLMGAVQATDVMEAFELLKAFFLVPVFHEDLIFEPLLQLDQSLRIRAAELQLKVPSEDTYADSVATFTAAGVTESQPPASLVHIPLPIQRRLARAGHFLSYFVSHNNERVARETLPHLLRLDDITRYLRITTIHRAVLTELARNKRYFRQEAPRLALLQNPKTPAPVARLFLPFLPHEQLRFLSVNRHISAEVRQLAEGYLERLAQRMK